MNQKLTNTHDPIKADLSPADDRVLLSDWMPPQVGVIPKIRIGQQWINVLWALPISFLLLVIGVAVAQALRELPAVQNFLLRYPGTSAQAVTAGFPAWLRIQHFLNFLSWRLSFALVSRFSPTTRVYIGSATAHLALIGFVFRRLSRLGGFGQQKTTR